MAAAPALAGLAAAPSAARRDLATLTVRRHFINGRFVSHVEIDRWSGIVREAILRFIVLLQRGYNAKDGKDRLHRDLLESALDQQKGDELREKSDYEQFFNSIVDSSSLCFSI